MVLITYEAIYIKYYKCILVVQHAMRIHHIVVCGLSDCTIFFSHYLASGTFKKN